MLTQIAEYKSLFKCFYLSRRLYASAYDFVSVVVVVAIAAVAADIAATLTVTIPFRLLLLPHTLTHYVRVKVCD